MAVEDRTLAAAPGSPAAPSAALAGAMMRSESELMRPERLSALCPTPLSFSRSLMRRMIGERWAIGRPFFSVDEDGQGEAVYRIDTGSAIFDFVVFSFAPAPPDARTDRIIGQHWDILAALLEGEATPERIEETRRELPKLYTGRAPAGTLVWCRSNRSLRLFEHVVESLAAGRQPDPKTLAEVCYILRNTGLDANGTFGTPSFLSYGDEHPLRIPYHAQMLAAYMMREFGADLAEAIAALRSPDAVALRGDVRRFIGLGNSSGLGLVLFANNHPRLLARWLELRERCLARAKAARVDPGAPEVERLRRLLERCLRFRGEDRINYHTFASSTAIAADLRLAAALVDELAERGTVQGMPAEMPWGAICDALAGRIGPESLEQLHALLVDLDPEHVDEINPEHVVSELFEYVPEMRLGHLRALLQEQYAWALGVDLEDEGAYRYFWYKSVEAEEPRRGIRGGGVEGFDLGLDLPGDAQRLDAALADCPEDMDVATFLLENPQHRSAVTRIQGLRGVSYHSVHANAMGDDFVPAHVIRLFNASMYGLDKTRDVEFSHNRWVRGVMFHGAPSAAEISAGTDPDWAFPPEPGA
jgi:hypothetical protein